MPDRRKWKPRKGAEAKVTHLPVQTRRASSEVPFPSEVIDGAAKLFVDYFSNFSEAAPQFWYFTYLTCLGNLTAQRFQLFTRAGSIEPRLYALLLGESAHTHKGTAPNQLLPLFGDVQPNLFHYLRGVGSGEGLFDELRDKPRILLYADEFGRVIQKSRGTSILMHILTEAFHSPKLEDRTRGSGRQRIECHLSFLGCCTVSEFINAFDHRYIQLGTLNRFLLIPGENRYLDPILYYSQPAPEADLRGLVKAVEMAMLASGIKSQLRTPHLNDMRKKLWGFDLGQNKEVATIYREWYLNHFKKWQGTEAARLDHYFAVLAMLMAINRGRHAIDDEIALNAKKLIEWQYKIRLLFAPTFGVSKAIKMQQRILEKLRLAPDRTSPIGHLINEVGRQTYDPNQIIKMIDALANIGYLELTKLENARSRLIQYVTLIRDPDEG